MIRGSFLFCCLQLFTQCLLLFFHSLNNCFYLITFTALLREFLIFQSLFFSYTRGLSTSKATNSTLIGSDAFLPTHMPCWINCTKQKEMLFKKKLSYLFYWNHWRKDTSPCTHLIQSVIKEKIILKHTVDMETDLHMGERAVGFLKSIRKDDLPSNLMG